MKKSESQSNFLKNSKHNLDDNKIEYNRSNTLENNANFVIIYLIN